MQTVIMIISGLVAVAGALLQLALIFEGLGAFGRFVLPFLFKEKLGWFGLWGGWHLIVFALLFKFTYDTLSAEMEVFQQVTFQLEGLRILGMYLVLPLLVSFLISRIHLYIRLIKYS